MGIVTYQAKTAKETAQEQEFIAKYGDLRPTLATCQHHVCPLAKPKLAALKMCGVQGQQYFDSADWSMYKDDAEKGRQLRQLPKISVERRPTAKIMRKSSLSCDSSHLLALSPLSSQEAPEFTTSHV